MSVISNYSIQGPPGVQGEVGATGAVGAIGPTGAIGPSSITGDPTVVVSGSSVSGYTVSAVQQLTTTSNPVFNQITVSAPQSSSQVATKNYVDSGLAKCVQVVTSGLNINSSITGNGILIQTVPQPGFNSVTLGAVPVNATDAARKDYVDQQITSAKGNVLSNIYGDTTNITATLAADASKTVISLNPNLVITQATVSGAVSGDFNIATKQYVDGQINTYFPSPYSSVTAFTSYTLNISQLLTTGTSPTTAILKSYTAVYNIIAAQYVCVTFSINEPSGITSGTPGKYTLFNPPFVLATYPSYPVKVPLNGGSGGAGQNYAVTSGCFLPSSWGTYLLLEKSYVGMTSYVQYQAIFADQIGGYLSAYGSFVYKVAYPLVVAPK